MTASQEDFEKNFSEIGAALSSKLNNRIVLYKKYANLICEQISIEVIESSKLHTID